MENHDKSEQLLDLLSSWLEVGISPSNEGLNKAYQLAGEVVCELEEAKARIKELEQEVAAERRALLKLCDAIGGGR